MNMQTVKPYNGTVTRCARLPVLAGESWSSATYLPVGTVMYPTAVPVGVLRHDPLARPGRSPAHRTRPAIRDGGDRRHRHQDVEARATAFPGVAGEQPVA